MKNKTVTQQMMKRPKAIFAGFSLIALTAFTGSVKAQVQINATSIIGQSCYAKCDGSATITASGGVSPYTYVWYPPFSTTNSATNLCEGSYTITATDQSGATRSLQITVNSPKDMFATIAKTNVSCNGGNNGSATISISGGTTPYTYTWSTKATNQSLNLPTITGLSAGIDSIFVNDANGCNVSGHIYIDSNIFTITEPAALSITPTSHNDVSCHGKSDGSCCAMPSGGTSPYSFTWSIFGGGGQTTQCATGLSAGAYTVHVIDANGCIGGNGVFTTITEPAYTCVWPGDANNDLVADNNDLLQLGLGYGNTGTLRSTVNISWAGQPSQDWSSLINSIDSKYADCNGDGIINANDTTAIILNYGLTHNKTGWINNATAVDPTLAFQPVKDTVLAGTAVSIPLILGSSSIPANNVYGLAFSLSFDTTIVKAGTMRMDFGPWLGIIGTNMISIKKEFYTNNRLDVGVTRIDHQPVSGSGQIGTCSFVLRDDLSGKNYIYKTLNLDFTKINMIDIKGNPVKVNAQGVSIVATQVTTGIIDNSKPSGSIKTFPNPASELITVMIDGEKNANALLEMYNHLGQIVYTLKSDVSNGVSINVKDFENGIYFLKITSGDKVMMKTMSVMH